MLAPRSSVQKKKRCCCICGQFAVGELKADHFDWKQKKAGHFATRVYSKGHPRWL
jgi:hypothetical protein